MICTQKFIFGNKCFSKKTRESRGCLQEVFVKIWKNIDSYNETKGRFTLGSHIARNTSIDKLRSKILTTARKPFYR
jgi:RNA polymerase sigma-70 factor (ECF subfamily)